MRPLWSCVVLQRLGRRRSGDRWPLARCGLGYCADMHMKADAQEIQGNQGHLVLSREEGRSEGRTVGIRGKIHLVHADRFMRDLVPRRTLCSIDDSPCSCSLTWMWPPMWPGLGAWRNEMRSHRTGTRRVWIGGLHFSASCTVSEASPLAPACRMCASSTSITPTQRW